MKKYINTVSFAKIAIFGFMLFSTLVNAQEDLPEAPDDTAPAPIDDYVWLLALIGLTFVFLKFRAFSKQRGLKYKVMNKKI
jgi:hypothetical protein